MTSVLKRISRESGLQFILTGTALPTEIITSAGCSQKQCVPFGLTVLPQATDR